MSDDTLNMLADAAAAFAKPDTKRVRALRNATETFDRKVWRDMAAQGWLSILVPEKLDGMGLNAAAAVTVATRLGYAGFPEPFVAAGVMTPMCLASGIAAEGPATAATAATRRLLSSVTEGERIVTMAWQGTRGDLDILRSGVNGTMDDGQVTLSGESRFVAAASADGFVVSARVGDGLGLYYVAREQRGLEIRTENCADGSRSAWLVLNRAQLPADACIAPPTAGAKILQHVVNIGTVATSAELVGLMDRALEMTLEYLRTRKQFGKAIGSFQALQHRAVDIWIQRQLARAVVNASVAVIDSPVSTQTARDMAASSAKARASHAALLLSNQALQLHGAIGFTDEYDLGLYLNRALVLSAWLGNAATHRKRFGALSAGVAVAN